jgi:c-di-GMP-binding flagellar brake protein YcgR
VNTIIEHLEGRVIELTVCRLEETKSFKTRVESSVNGGFVVMKPMAMRNIFEMKQDDAIKVIAYHPDYGSVQFCCKVGEEVNTLFLTLLLDGKVISINRRQAFRVRSNSAIHLYLNEPTTGVLMDASGTGLQFEANRFLPVGFITDVEFALLESAKRRVGIQIKRSNIKPRDLYVYGCEFTSPIDLSKELYAIQIKDRSRGGYSK